MSLEQKVKHCYEDAPFPDSLRKAKNFNKELDRIVKWTKLNLDFLSNELISKHPKAILCAGCGTGEEVIALSRIYPKSKILGVDISNASISIALQNIKKARVKNVKILKCSIIDDLPNLSRKFDLVYSCGVIHHLSNPRKGFSILSTKLTKRGKMIIMLYNSYGLFFYKCQLWILDFLSGKNISIRMFLVRLLDLGKGKSKAFVYDAYINPQVTTYSIEKIIQWSYRKNLKITGVVPPLSLKLMINYGTEGKDYYFRRKGLISFGLKVAKKIFGQNKRDINISLNLNPVVTFLYQIIFLIFGRGETVYLLEKK
ncbi:MAG: class I SAM-dependent methyltransferase [Candidatus Woesebacteria bacterium]|nr:MAG: class I SAM-dependent methyltransferase [Candidatus Woesebacteria bacterium]